MKAGLITFHFANHYGAQLQAYATMRAVEQMGTPCEIIDYRLPHTTQTNRLYQKGRSPKTMLTNLHTALHHKTLARRNERFAAFVAEQMHCSQMRYETIGQLQENPPQYDLYISGSDQIWSPSIFVNGRFDPAFFLAFAAAGRKISYASSFGGAAVPAAMEDELEGYLASFDAVSARENQAKQVLEQAMEQEVPTVLDPTLLLTGADWGEIAASPAVDGPYILCYFISDYSDLLPHLQAVQKETGYPIVQLAGMRRRVPGAKKIIFDAGPREFLGLFQNAAYVLTNSFHGTVFSLQFEKPFFTMVSPKERSHPENSRIYHLLNLVGQTDRIIGLQDTAPVGKKIDYETVKARLAKEREASLDFLRRNLEAAKEKRWMGEKDIHPPKKKVRLAPAELCTGCSACQAACPMNCISMEPDGEGFLRPVIGEDCIRCRTCETACPILQQTPDAAPDTEETAQEKNQLPKVYAAWNRQEDVKRQSTSGGVFSALAGHILAQRGVVYGAAFDETFRLSHICVEKAEDLPRLRGAKYVQSDLKNCFKEIKDRLDLGKTVLFSGTPCQVDGLRQYLRTSYSNLILCDLVCHGVPSPAVWDAAARQMEETEGSPLTAVSFREKSDGWSRARFTAAFANGNQITAPLMKTPFGRGFGMALFLRPSCYRCRYAAVQRDADLTLGDFWGVSAQSLPKTLRLEDGVSLVLVHTPKGQALLDAVEQTVDRTERPLAEAVAGNPRLVRPIEKQEKREAFFAAFSSQSFAEIEQKFLQQPSLPYRIGARLLPDSAKKKIRALLR